VTIVWALIAVAVVVAVVAAWRVALRDPSVRRIRLGVFWEKDERDDKPEGVPSFSAALPHGS